MANTATITRQSVSKTPGGYILTVNVVINDGSGDILESTFSKRHYSADPINEVKDVFAKKIKEEWDKLKAEKGIFEKAEFSSMCSDLQSDINNYINT